MQINITLAVFNLLPISPLDGSQILTPFIEKHFGIVYKMEMYGPRVLLFVIIFSMVTGIQSFLWSLIQYLIFFFIFLNIDLRNLRRFLKRPKLVISHFFD